MLGHAQARFAGTRGTARQPPFRDGRTGPASQHFPPIVTKPTRRRWWDALLRLQLLSTPSSEKQRRDGNVLCQRLPRPGTIQRTAMGVSHDDPCIRAWAWRLLSGALVQHELQPLFCLLLAAAACAGGDEAPSVPHRGTVNQAFPDEHQALIGLSAVGPDIATVGPVTVCGSDCEPALTEEPSPLPPPAPVAPSPLPEACPGGPAPSIMALDPTGRIGDIAMSSTHIYWITSDSIRRRAKAGGGRKS